MTAVIAPGPTRRPLRDLERPSHLFANLGPNWFATIVGTGMVANAGAGLPVGFPGLRTAATVVWAFAAVVLVLLGGAWAVHWTRHRETARSHAHDPVMAQFWGAPPMALTTVGTGTLLLGRDWIGLGPALAVDWTLWCAGTVLGLITTVWIPYRMMTTHDITSESPFGAWLMPVVPPVVSAAGGALLIPYLPDGQLRLTVLLACCAMFGTSLVTTLVILPQIWQRFVRHKTGPAAALPTIWILLGPPGLSITAATLLGDVLPAPYDRAGPVIGLLLGVPAWGFAMTWLALATALTVRATRRGLPFSLTWWSFTFPLGALVTGTNALATRTHSVLFTATSVGLFALLVTAWLVVAIRTALGGYRGHLFRAPAGGARQPVAATTSDSSPVLRS